MQLSPINMQNYSSYSNHMNTDLELEVNFDFCYVTSEFIAWYDLFYPNAD